MRKQLLAVAVLALTFAALGACKAREESAPPPAQAAPAAVAPAEATPPAAEPPQTVVPVAEPTGAAPAPGTTAPSSEKPKSAPASPKTSPAVPAAAAVAPVPPSAVPAVPASKPSPALPAPVAPAPKAGSVVDPGGDVAVASTKPGLTRIGAEKCKLCHKVQHASWAASAHAKRTPPLECESCHGPGSEYKVIGVMKDPAKAKQAGLVVPNAGFCDKCHKGTVDAAFLAKVHAHKTTS